jgi:isopentenyl-diphosphate delta-isomerase
VNSNPEATNANIASDTLILVDEHDNETGSCEKVDCHVGQGKLHRAFSVFLFNPEGKLLIQQRSAQKMLWGGYWANSCCSHPRLGEDTDAAARRRVNEELGTDCELQYLYRFVYHAEFGAIGSEHENCHVYAGHFDGTVNVDPDEISAWEFVTPDELTADIEANSDKYSPWLKLEWQEIRERFLADLIQA